MDARARPPHHLRRALARSLRTGGEIPRLPRRRRRSSRARSCCCATSAARWSATRGRCCSSRTRCRAARGDVEAFLFATRLTRITMELRAPETDAAIAAVSRAVRTGRAARASARRCARFSNAGGAARCTAARGDPDFRRLGSRRPRLLREEIARLQRSCHRLIWLNPLIGTVDYAPLTRGLQAALPRRRFPAQGGRCGTSEIWRYS